MATAPDSTKTPTADPALVAAMRRRRLGRRLRLSAPILAALAVAAALGWQAGRHMVATACLIIDRVEVDWRTSADDWYRGGTTRVHTFSARHDPEDIPTPALGLLSWLHRVETLDLSELPGLGDNSLACLDQLTDLASLRLGRPSNLPPALAAKLPRLTDATLARIRGLVKLQELSLAGQAITDAGLVNLVGLDRLETLDLEGTAVTDAGLVTLKRLKGLKSVDLTGTRVTLEAARRFELGRPGVAITVDGSIPEIR